MRRMRPRAPARRAPYGIHVRSDSREHAMSDRDRPQRLPGRAAVSQHILMRLIHHWYVTRGLDPRVHLLRKKMDCRVKPGNDVDGWSMPERDARVSVKRLKIPDRMSGSARCC